MGDFVRARERTAGCADGRGVAGVIAALIHELQNDLQIVRMGVDLVQAESGASADLQSVLGGIARIEALTQQLRDYFFPAETRPSKVDAGIVLGDAVRQMERSLKRRGIRLRMDRPESLPPVRIDRIQLRRALDQVLQFACAILPEGGELAAAALRAAHGRPRVELKITSSASCALNIDGQDVFKPFLRINGYQAGLNLLIASEIIRRHEGKISFQNDDPSQGSFSILLEAVAD